MVQSTPKLRFAGQDVSHLYGPRGRKVEAIKIDGCVEEESSGKSTQGKGARRWMLAQKFRSAPKPRLRSCSKTERRLRQGLGIVSVAWHCWLTNPH